MKLIRWIKKNKIISVVTLLSIVLIITFIVLLTTTLFNNEKDKQKRTFLDRDGTEIVCQRYKKIGSIKIKYKTKDEPTNIKYTIQLWCTEKPNRKGIDNEVRSAERKFFSKYEKKMNLKDSNIYDWDAFDTVSKEWDKKYPDNYFIN